MTQQDEAPLCGCGCGERVKRGKNYPYSWNKFIKDHQNKGKNNPNYGKTHTIIFCAQCGKEKEIKPSEKAENNFCNKKCYYEWKNKKITIKCAQCGKEKKIPPWQKKIYNFCNKKCHVKWNVGPSASPWKGGTSNYQEMKKLGNELGLSVEETKQEMRDLFNNNNITQTKQETNTCMKSENIIT